MAISVLRTCDRCKKPYGAETFDMSQPLPQLQRPTLHIAIKNIDGSEVVLASFTDMCPGCDTAVTNYLGLVRMEPKKQGKRDKNSDAKTEAVEETSEAKSVTEVAPASLPAPVGPVVTPAVSPSNGEQKPARPEAF